MGRGNMELRDKRIQSTQIVGKIEHCDDFRSEAIKHD